MPLSYVCNNNRHPRLPPELFRPIFKHLDGHRPTFFALSLCNRYLREDAERELYTRIDASLATDPSLHIAFLTTVSQNRRLASYVRVYHINSIVHYRKAPLWNLLYRALRCMTGLKVLHLRVSGGHPAAELLLDVPFQLERMHWGNHSEGWKMTTVLEQQQHLRYLYLESEEGTTFPLICCPHLKELSGNRGTLEALLHGRRVENVEWVPELDDDTGSGGVSQIGAELGHLKGLSFGGYFARPYFGHIVDYLERLEKLALVGLLSDELLLLKRVKPLRELVISFHWGSRDLSIPRETDQRQRLVEDLFSWCENLLCVDIAYESTTHTTEIWYQRWTRETTQSSPIMVSPTEIKYGWFGGGGSASNI
ncbi:hypothetical protein BJ912DRAFT_1063998 [Pholiota molesta]|nr:hypothetical protein BJ912DRAFT_1063998 [Pholiota molesta]